MRCHLYLIIKAVVRKIDTLIPGVDRIETPRDEPGIPFLSGDNGKLTPVRRFERSTKNGIPDIAPIFSIRSIAHGKAMSILPKPPYFRASFSRTP